MNKVVLEIGGNQGDRLKNIIRVTELIMQNIGVIKKKSSIYETPPWGFCSEQDFYNQVLLISTNLPVKEVLENALQIERKLGRVRGNEQFSSRTMDIDILFFNDEIINTEELIVPHPRLHLRRFVLEPMCEIDRSFKHPAFNKTVELLLSECEDNAECTKIN